MRDEMTRFVQAALLALAFSAFSTALVNRNNGGNVTAPYPVIELSAPDDSIMATFIPWGATATSLWVKGRNGQLRDVLLGFDDPAIYADEDYGRVFFGPVVGRYANRIRNGTFTVPISKNANASDPFQVPKNENNGTNSLHGGNIGYDRRLWTITSQSENAVTFSLRDPDGREGFPGTVTTDVTYALKEGGIWDIYIYAEATEETPIMLSGHHFWNLEAYEETQDLVGHYVQFNSSRAIATDGRLIPDGTFIDTAGTPLDFSEPRSVGSSINDTAAAEYCGTGCVGYDNCWVFDEPQAETPIFSAWSVNSGIRLDITTNQEAIQIYSCNGVLNPDLPTPRKASQGGPSEFYENHSCLVIEPESYIDAINNPEFGVDQIYGPDRPYEWQATYQFSVVQ